MNTTDRATAEVLDFSTTSEDQSPAHSFHPVVVAPTYNHAFALIDVLDRIEVVGLPVIVVNDGSTDETAARLAEWESANRTLPVEILTHARNRGKADALRTGFAAARIAGYTHAVTIDTDGQLLPEDIPRLLEVSQSAPDALVLGVRRNDIDDCPKSNRLGWWITALGVWLETGRRFLDNQCGLRVYPLQAFHVIASRSPRFTFETEMVTRFSWAGSRIVEVPVTCVYPPAGKRVSHFKLHRDAVVQFLFHAWLTIRHLIPLPHRKLKHRQHSAPSPSSSLSWLEWISPIALWRNLRRDRFEQLLVAAAAGIGTFMSAMPLGGWQIGLAAYASKRLHVQLIPTLIGSMLCMTPIGAFQRDLSMGIGQLLFHFSWPGPEMFDAARMHHWDTLLQMPFAWLLGAVVVGFFSNWITIPALVHLFKLIPVQHQATPGQSTEHSTCT